MDMNRKRVAAGIPTGGQFAQQARDESAVTLGAPPALTGLARLKQEEQARERQRQQEYGRIARESRRADHENRSTSDIIMPPAAPDQPRNVGFMAGSSTVMDWDTGTPVDPGTLTGDEADRLRQLSEASGKSIPREVRRAMNQRRRPGAAATAEKIVDEIAETGEALSGLAGRLADVQRGSVTTDSKGTFVGWGDMVPKFLRRKN